MIRRAISTLTEGIAVPENGTLEGAAAPRGDGYPRSFNSAL
jgi:hypothetical protein